MMCLLTRLKTCRRHCVEGKQSSVLRKPIWLRQHRLVHSAGESRATNRSRIRLWTAADTGSVTAEFAVVLPAVVAVALLLIALSRTVTVSMRCQDAAAIAVRELVVSGQQADPQTAAIAVAGEGASVSVDSNGNQVSVTVSCPVLPGPLDVLPTRVTGEAVGVMQ